MTKAERPTPRELAWWTLKCLERFGGSASIEQIARCLAEFLSIPEDILRYPAGWTRTYLKDIGAVENPARGIWRITNRGRGVPDERTLLEALKNGTPLPEPPNLDENRRGEDSTCWRGELLDLLLEMEPKSFIHLCKKILNESGFRQIEVADRTGNGDIYGSGILRIGLVSFHIRFQFRRSTTPIDDAEIRDLRVAMVGRAEKGLFVTTGTFTDSASKEAVRDGAPVIDLISGNELCNHLRDLGLGVSTTMVQIIEIDADYFRNQ